MFPLVALLLLSPLFAALVKLPYVIHTKGVIYPSKEWTLTKAAEGQMAFSMKDHFNNSVSHYGITEFQRGDHGEFVLHQDVFSQPRIHQGDTIGLIRSNEEQTRYIELLGELENQKKLLEVYTSGGRKQDVAVAREMMELAQKEYQAQEKLMVRSEKLFQQNVIPRQEYELAQNEYEIKRMAVEIARSEYQAVTAGAKPQEIDLVRSQIRAIQAQLDQLENRLNSFTILSPFSGMIIRERQLVVTEQVFIRIADDSSFIVVFPVEVHQLPYIREGQKVELVPENVAEPVLATVAQIGNSVQMINRRQNVFVTAILDDHLPHFLPGMLVRAEVDAGTITLREYAARMINTIYSN